METYAMLTKLAADALDDPSAVARLNRELTTRMTRQGLQVKWLGNYAVSGPYDYLDIFEAPDTETATKVMLLVRSIGHATAETWLATSWDRFVDMASRLKS
ncbi:MAG: GYD domain-containing protein [Candidatus Binataceae bacterium]